MNERSFSPKRLGSFPPPYSPVRAPLPFLVRLSLVSLALVFSVIALTMLNPSPWIAQKSPFLRPPPSLSIQNLGTPAVQGCPLLSSTTLEPRERGAIVLLLREADLEALLPTLRNFEDKFNGAFRYPYVFLSSPDEPPLSEAFQEGVRRTLPHGAETEWAVVPERDWSIPEWLDEREMREGFRRQEEGGVQYAGREGYHHMCRFYSGLFARQEVLRKYDWYWRLEPGVTFFCSIRYDPFRFLSLNDKVYGFVITIVENAQTIPTLFNTMTAYARRNYLSPGPNLWDFFTREDGHGKGRGRGDRYNMCHFWTNFEIGDLRFFRSAAYQDLFDNLDQAGGFYTERWGDAPIRSLALGLLTDIDRVHYFEDIGYQHDDFVHCPKRGNARRVGLVELLDLPPELLLKIIKRSVPDVGCHWEDYKKRSMQLKCLSLTCKSLLPLARSLLYRDVRVAGPAPLSLLARTLDEDNLQDYAKSCVKSVSFLELDISTVVKSDQKMATFVLDWLLGGGLGEVCFVDCEVDEVLLAKLTTITQLKFERTAVAETDVGSCALRLPALTSLKIDQKPGRVVEGLEWFINSTSLPSLTQFEYTNYSEKWSLDPLSVAAFRSLAPQLEQLALDDDYALYTPPDRALWQAMTELKTLTIYPVLNRDAISGHAAEDEIALRYALEHLDHSLETLTVLTLTVGLPAASDIVHLAFRERWRSVSRLKSFNVVLTEADAKEGREQEEQQARAVVDEVVNFAKKYKIELNK